MKPFIGIKKIWYGDVITTAPTKDSLESLIASMHEVTTSHDGTWGYTEDDPDITDYVNELTGKPYYRDATKLGNRTITFTLGMYNLADKVALQGGEISSDGVWKSPDDPQVIYKSIVAKTKTGAYVIFTNAAIVGKTDTQEKNLGLGISAVAMENTNEGVGDEYWVGSYDSAVDAADKKGSEG